MSTVKLNTSLAPYVGTVTNVTVSSGSGLSLTGTSTVNPTIGVASGYMIPTTEAFNNKAEVGDLPTVNNSTVTIQKNGTSVGSFTLNQSTAKTINIEVPTNNNQLTNGANYITMNAVGNATLTIQKNGSNVGTFTSNSSTDTTINITVPTDNSELGNGAGYITAASLPTVNNGTLTIQNNGTNKATFSANQSGDTTVNFASVAFSGSYSDLSNKPSIYRHTVSITEKQSPGGTPSIYRFVFIFYSMYDNDITLNDLLSWCEGTGSACSFIGTYGNKSSFSTMGMAIIGPYAAGSSTTPTSTVKIYYNNTSFELDSGWAVTDSCDAV